MHCALIVGAGGYVGTRMRAALEADGVRVHAASSRDGSGIDPRTGCLPPDFVVPHGVEVVYYVAHSPYHRPGEARLAHLLAVNAASAAAVADASRRAGAQRLVYLSTGNVYRPSFEPLAEAAPLRRDDPHALSKVHGEEGLDLFRKDLEVVVARLFGVFGPDQEDRLVPAILGAVRAGRPITLWPRPVGPGSVDDGGLRLSLTYIEDLIAVLRALAQAHAVETVNVASDQAVSIEELARACADLLGRQARFERRAEPRGGDLIADVTLLRQYVDHRFHDWREALARVASS